MNASKFVEVIRRVVFQLAAVDGTIRTLRKGPSGRRPDPNLKLLSEWYKALPQGDRDRVEEIIRQAAKSAVFNFLVVLDGDLQIEDPDDRGTLALWHEKDGKDVLLNDPNGERLHDLFIAQ
ncbi:MAG: hypothetical protein QOJ45_279 [Verrucomicrobiota bacterium]|jgi:hypothetical protein